MQTIPQQPSSVITARLEITSGALSAAVAFSLDSACEPSFEGDSDPCAIGSTADSRALAVSQAAAAAVLELLVAFDRARTIVLASQAKLLAQHVAGLDIQSNGTCSNAPLPRHPAGKE